MFHNEPTPPRAVAVPVARNIQRIVADNSSKMTYHGTNTYILSTNQGVFIIDPGPSEDFAHYGAILNATGNHLAGIIVTHQHSDHFGLVPALHAETGSPVFASRKFPDDAFVPDVYLDDGDKIGGLTVLHTPGHASDHLCFSRPDGILFTGDHVMTWSSSMVGPPDGNMSDYCEQLTRLIDRRDSTYLPGHGPPLDDPVPYVERLLANRVRREGEILRQVARAPETSESLAKMLYRKTDPHLAMAAERNVIAHLQKLKSDGLVQCSNGVWIRT